VTECQSLLYFPLFLQEIDKLLQKAYDSQRAAHLAKVEATALRKAERERKEKEKNDKSAAKRTKNEKTEGKEEKKKAPTSSTALDYEILFPNRFGIFFADECKHASRAECTCTAKDVEEYMVKKKSMVSVHNTYRPVRWLAHSHTPILNRHSHV